MEKINIKFILSFCIGFGMLYFVLSHYNLSDAVMTIRRADLYYLSLGLVFLIAAYIARGFRWQLWEKKLSFQDSFELILVGFMGNNIFPARFGEVLRAHCAAEKTRYDFGRTAALGSIFTERIFDAFIISIIAILSLILVTLSSPFFIALLSVALFFIVFTVLFFACVSYHIPIIQKIDRLSVMFPGHLTNIVKEKISYFMDGVMQIGSLHTVMRVLSFSALVWIVEFYSYYYISKALIGHLSIGDNLLFLSTVNFASLFPITIAGIGAIEGVATAFLVDVGVNSQQALAVVLTQHTLQFLFTVILGGYFYFKGRYYNVPLMKFKKEDLISKRESLSLQELKIQETKDSVNRVLMNLGENQTPRMEIPLTIVIPAYNETNRLPKTILETISWCKKNNIVVEIIIVDDGSTDSTSQLGRLFSDQFSGVKFIACPHAGKGFAVKIGMLNACGEVVLFMDADGATALEEIDHLMNKMAQGYDIVIGSRVNLGEGNATVVAKKHRKIIGRFFAALVNMFAISGIGDTQCGFKMFRKQILIEVFRRQKLNGFAFDVEILYIAKKLSLEIAEVSVNWTSQDESKVNLIVDSIKMLKDVILIKWSHKATDWDVEKE